MLPHERGGEKERGRRRDRGRRRARERGRGKEREIVCVCERERKGETAHPVVPVRKSATKDRSLLNPNTYTLSPTP